jgi:hypothetical protein
MKINILLPKKHFTMIFINFAIMAKKQKSKKRNTSTGQPLIVVDPALSSFEGHPFFEKKAANAKALLDKVGLPKELSDKGRP